MNDVLAPELLQPQVPPPLPPAAASRMEFANARPQYRRLVMRGALLELITVGFYRFWLATDMRRHLWSHTAIEGDAPEYTGTGKELLIGFLFALAIIVPLNVGYFVLGLEAERLKAFASFPLAVLYYLFWQFATYRARRYRLTRTVWRGVRFSMGGSGLNYCWRAALWSLFSLATLGLALPWRQAALERFKMRYTAYGNLAGRFEGTGGQLFKRGWLLWLLSLLLLGALIAAGFLFGKTAMVMAATIGRPTPPQVLDQMLTAMSVFWLTVLVALVVFPFLLAMYRSIEWRWWISGIRLGDVSFESDLGRGRLIGLYWKMVGWSLLIIIVFSAWSTFVFQTAKSQVGGGTMEQQIFLTMQHPLFYAGTVVGYIFCILAFWTVTRIYMIHDVWNRVTNSVTAHNLASAVDVAEQGQLVSALGEGLADSLDVAGF
jgi:uncharacterized membrane protein YjgN (DUF898 family)